MSIRFRTDLERIRLGEFALPLGIEPLDRRPPTQGYTVSYNAGEDDDPDTYTFHVVVSHERVRPLIDLAFQLLPNHVSPIVEVDSYDAYRTIDVFIGREEMPISRDAFLDTWREFENVILEDGALGAGANSEEPFIEIFVDQWKSVTIHVPLDMRDTVEMMLQRFGLTEVAETWPATDESHAFDATIRPVLDDRTEDAMTLDDVVLELRRAWNLELNVDPDRNLDEGGRELGLTLWHAGVVAFRDHDDPVGAAFLSVWASARSLSELESLIEGALRQHPEWGGFECYSVTRVAYDDRPDVLEQLTPRRDTPEVHLVAVEPVDHHTRKAQDG